MARIGLKSLTYATLSSGGDGAAAVYANGAMVNGKMIKADVSIEREDVSLYADNARVEHANGVTGGTINLELAGLDDTLREKLLGYTKNDDDELEVTDTESPNVGFGYVTCEINGGVKSYIGYWFWKVQFGTDSDSAETKGENSSFQTESLTGQIMGVNLTAGGTTKFYKTFADADEADVVAWLKTCANITTVGG